MLVQEIMHPNPIVIGPDVKLCDAYALMHDQKIRHLPVLENGMLMGIVTDRDLRLATSRLATHPFDPEARIEEVMNTPVQTAHPAEPVEHAIHMMRELKIGCLPVLDENMLVGIVTGADLLDAMLRLTGVNLPSGRLDLRLINRPGELARLAQLLAEHHVNIHSILTYMENGTRGRLVLRVGTMEIRALAKAICEAGFEVIWPPGISCTD